MLDLTTPCDDDVYEDEAVQWALPPEVTALVLSCLAPDADRLSLIACATVCTTWNDLARPILFSWLKISVSSNVDDTTVTAFVGTPKYTPTLATHLRSTAARILPHVHTLVLFHQNLPVSHRVGAFIRKDLVEVEDLLGTLEQFPNVKHLGLMNILLASPPGIDTPTLDLDQLDYSVKGPFDEGIPCEQFMWPLRLFGSIQNFCADIMTYSTRNNFDPDAFPLPALRVRSYTDKSEELVPSFTQALLHSPSLQVLESVDFSNLSMKRDLVLPTLLISERGLSHIGLSLLPALGTTRDESRLLSEALFEHPQLASLRSLTTSTFMLSFITTQLTRPSWLALFIQIEALTILLQNLLKYQPSSNLETFHLCICGPYIASVDELLAFLVSPERPVFQFLHVESVLLRFPNLKQVNVSYKVQDGSNLPIPAAFHILIQAWFPLISDSGRLKVLS